MTRDPRFSAHRLDVNAFATAESSLTGETTQHELRRLSDSLMALPGDMAPPPVRWVVAGAMRTAAGAPAQPWLHLDVDASVTLQCQRCLQPLGVALHIDRWFRFVGAEDEAARLDEDCEEDVLVASPRFNLLELVEDELILALPLVPMHKACPEPLPMAPDEPATEPVAPHPFAALAALRRTDADE